MKVRHLIFVLLLLLCTILKASSQADSSRQTISKISRKYVSGLDQKISLYNDRVYKKTIKTLQRLANWENRIKRILERVNPPVSDQLFNRPEFTFKGALDKFTSGEQTFFSKKAIYDAYKDKLITSINYLDKSSAELNNQLIDPVKKLKQKLQQMDDQDVGTEALAKFIKERKQLLISQSGAFLNNSKMLQKMDKETFYYVQTIKNYKELLKNEGQAERLAMNLLNKIPSFQIFFRKQSMFASLFGMPDPAAGATQLNLAGLQTTGALNSLLQNQMIAAGASGQQMLSQGINEGKAKLNALKDKLAGKLGGDGDNEIPGFKSSETKSKTFRQRLEYGLNFQSSKTNTLLPQALDIATEIAYKITDRSLFRLGASFKIGYGSIQHIKFSSEGIGLRTAFDWKLKKQFAISAGFEMNYYAGLKDIKPPKGYTDFQPSALAGLSKTVPAKIKWAKGTRLQLLYDFVAKRHTPVSQPFLFRVGYQF